MNKRFHKLLIRIYNAHKKISQSRFSELGLTSGQPKILEKLREIDGCMQKELAAACNIEPATITSILPNMEKNGLIKRENRILTSGKRSLSVNLTEKGNLIERKVAGIIDEVEELSLKGFTEGEKELFLSMLERVYENIK